MELNALQLSRPIFFPSVSIKKNENIQKYAQKCKTLEKKLLKYFLHFILLKIKLKAACDALLQGFVNELK